MDASPEETTVPIAVHESWLPPEHPMHRPRHGRRQRFALVCAVVFFLLPFGAFVVGVRAAPIENHRLAGFPSPARGFGMFTRLGPWATDNLPLRDVGVHAEDAISRGVFGEIPQQNRSGTPLGLSSGGSSPGGSAPGGSGRDLSERDRYPDVVQGKDGWLYYGYDMSMKCVPSRPMDDVIASVRRFERIVRDSGRTPVVIVPPDKSTMLPQHMPDQYAGKQCMESYRSRFWPKLTGTTDTIDVRGRLRRLERTDDYPIYFRSDTHWQDRSAIAALRAVCERLRPGVSDTWQVDKVGTVERHGDLSRLAGGTYTEPWPRYRLSPDGERRTVTNEPPNLHKPVTVTNEPRPGMVTQPTTIVGDSFSLAMDRYAASAFTDVTFASYESMRGGIPTVLDQMARSKVVVLEMLERGMATGDSALLRPEGLAALKTVLAQHPVK